MQLYERVCGILGETLAKAVQEALDRALADHRPELTPFMGAQAGDALKETLVESKDVVYRTYGGYRGSNRIRMAIAPLGYEWEGFDPQIGYFQIIEAKAGIDEMLTYIKAAGVQEQEIGDVFSSGGDTIGVSTLQAAVRLSTKGVDVQGFPHGVKQPDPYEIAFPGQGAKRIRATVNSMRIDAVAACGFPASRTRLAAEIELGRAKLNGKVLTDSAARIRLGDVIVIKGRGRITVDEEGPVTKKGRLSIVISKYSVL